MDRGVRVLVLTTLFPHRAGEKEGNFVLDQVRALTKNGADVTVLVAKPWHPLPSLAPENKRKINVQEYAGERFGLRNASFFSLPRFALGEKAYDFARQGILPAIDVRGNFDVIHAHGFLMGSVANFLARESKVPSVVTVHGIETNAQFDDTEGKRKKIGEAIDHADQMVIVGSPLIEYCRQYASRTDHFVVVGNGCTIYKDLEPSQRILRRKSARVVAISNYEENKGFDLLVEAMATAGLRDKMELVIVGGGDGFKKVQAHVQELGLGDSIHFTGLLPHRDALAEIMAGDVFCLPSWREAYGIMYAEAMALGKLTMGCKGQGPSDFVRHLETGYLMEPGSTPPVAEALRWALEHPDDASKIARHGQEYALSSLTWDANAAKMLEIYGRLIQERARDIFGQAQNRTTPA